MSVIREYKVANGYKIMCERYNSAAEVVNDAKTRKITNSRFDNMAVNLGGKSSSWCGVKNYEEALQLLSEGYQPVVEKLKVEIKANVQGNAKRVSFTNDIVGYAPVVPLAIMGVPNAMINSHMTTIKTKVIDVYYDGTFYSGVKSDDILKTGAKLLSVIISLEQQGYRFNLYQAQGYADGEDCDMLVVKIKDAAQPFDLKRVSFPMTHTAFFRVIGFDWYSKTPRGKFRFAYGNALVDEGRAKGKIDEIAKTMFGENAVYISGEQLRQEGSCAEEYLKERFTKCKNGIKA